MEAAALEPAAFPPVGDAMFDWRLYGPIILWAATMAVITTYCFPRC
jgi:hypothetical protein